MYVSELTRFLRDFVQKNPQVVEQQWDQCGSGWDDPVPEMLCKTQTRTIAPGFRERPSPCREHDVPAADGAS